MTDSVTVNGNTYTSDSNASTGMGNGGSRVRLIPMLADTIVEIGLQVAASAATAGAGFTGTSTTSASIGTGAKTLTTQASKLFAVGEYVKAYETATPANYMIGQVTGYNSTTGVLAFTVASGDTGGSGTITAWTIALSGVKGSTGATGPTGATGATGATGPAGDMTNPMSAAGDLIYGGASPAGTPTRLPKATNGQYLKLVAGVPAWADISTSLVRDARTSDTALTTTDRGNLIEATTGGYTQTFVAVATLTSGWFCWFKNSSTSPVTLDPNGSETIDGRTTIVVYPGESFLIQCNGSVLFTIGRKRKGDLVLISETALTSAATVDFSAGFTDTEFDDVVFKLENVGLASAGNLYAKISTASTFQSSSYLYAAHHLSSASSSPVGQVSASAAFINILGAGGTDNPMNGEITIYGHRGTSQAKPIKSVSSHFDGTNVLVTNTVAMWNGGTGAIDGFRLYPSSGNFAAQGSIQQFGRRN